MKQLTHRLPTTSFFIVCLLILFSSPTFAQQNAGNSLFITGSNTNSAPTIDLQLYGIDGNGDALSLSPASVSITQGGEAVTDIQTAGFVDAGTFTIFLIDIPPGVADDLTNIQNTISGFASPTTMQEQVDYVAVYQVGATSPVQLLAPTNFHNGVQNLFVDPLQPEPGATALLDSLGNLINQVDSLKPNPALATSIVLISDGTDVVSNQFNREDIPALAASKGIPIHTIHLNNVNLGQPEVGQGFMRDFAVGSRGNAGTFADEASLNAMWSKITGLRARTILRYTAPSTQGGNQIVTVSLIDDPATTATATVNLPTDAPTVALNIPIDARTITIPNTDETITLKFNAEVSWLDGSEHEVTQAQFYVNGFKVADVDPADLAEFTADITQFTYGQNTLQLAIVDDEGRQATSANTFLDVVEGDTNIPEALQAGSGGRTVLWILLLCLLFLGLVGGVIYFLSSRDNIDIPKVLDMFKQMFRINRRYRPAPAVRGPIQDIPSSYGGDNIPTAVERMPALPDSIAYLELLESVTHAPQFSPLQPVETRIGRSPAQADVTFENDITVSRLHASIIYSEGEHRLYDEGSTSGTLLNEQPVPEYGAPLIDGDEIRFGAVRVIFHMRK